MALEQRSRDRDVKLFLGYGESLSEALAKVMRQEIRRWQISSMNARLMLDLAEELGPVMQDWINY